MLLKVVKKSVHWVLSYMVSVIVWPFAVSLKTVFGLQAGYLSSSRIGHFAFDVAWYLATKQLEEDKDEGKKKAKRRFNMFFVEAIPCNEFLEQMVRRKLFTVRVPRKAFEILTSAPTLRNYWLHPARLINGSRDPDGRVYRSRNLLSFSMEENLAGRKYLSERGFSEHTRFACLIVRDAGYLRRVNQERGQVRDTSYHDYRDSDIETYCAAAEYLADNGYVVFRMGKHMERPMHSDSQRIIDYAFSDERCDFLDIWLMANCAFCISTGTGLDVIATIFRRPTLYLNFLPLGDIWSSQYCVTVPKKLYWSVTGNLLSVHEYMEHSYHSLADYHRNDIEIRVLSSDEILNAAIEMDQRVDGCWKETEVASLNQDRFWHMFRSSPGFSANHDWVNPKARVGASFVAKYGEEFLSGS